MIKGKHIKCVLIVNTGYRCIRITYMHLNKCIYVICKLQYVNTGQSHFLYNTVYHIAQLFFLQMVNS